MAWIRNDETTRPEERGELRPSPDWLGFSLLAVCMASLLAMAATWFLVTSVPLPDDEALHLGLLLFLFVMLVDVFFIVRLARSRMRRGQPEEAVKVSAGLILLGLLAASAVASLPWLWIWLTGALPELPKQLLVLLLIAEIALGIVGGIRRLARKAPS